MCVITDQNNVVVSISFICGCVDIPDGFHIYFPVTDSVSVGEYYKP